MQNKILAMVAVTMLVGLSAQAVLQHTVSSSVSPNPSQTEGRTRQLSVRINGGGSLWMASPVMDWAAVPDLGSTARMTANNYGWTEMNGEIYYSNGETMEVTFTNSKNPAQSVSTTAYYIGDFEANEEIWLVVDEYD
ncbi:MAG: hypothetical protein GX937_11945 [Lentisphaerae bacterium]|jgi:hypothetical protein|nr:hypothetical protein [Lentisphaerota bacterium]